jgi:hypothetical protein
MATRLDAKPASTGAMANNLREFESLREFFTSGTLVTLVDLPFIFLFVGVIFIVAGPVAFVPLAMVPLVILAGLILQYPLRSVIEKSQREASQKHAMLVEAIDGLETIKATAAEGRVQKCGSASSAVGGLLDGKARFISGLATTFAQIAIADGDGDRHRLRRLRDRRRQHHHGRADRRDDPDRPRDGAAGRGRRHADAPAAVARRAEVPRRRDEGAGRAGAEQEFLHRPASAARSSSSR